MRDIENMHAIRVHFSPDTGLMTERASEGVNGLTAEVEGFSTAESFFLHMIKTIKC